MVYYDFMKPNNLKDRKAAYIFACNSCKKKIMYEDICDGKVLRDFWAKKIYESQIEQKLSELCSELVSADVRGLLMLTE